MNSKSSMSKGPKDNRVNPKKVLNKKKWREQQYNNKAKVLKWENIKRKQALRKYHKELKKAGININVSEQGKVLEQKKNFSNSLKRAQLQYQKIQEEKEKKRKEKELDRQTREAALKAYKEKKAVRQQKLFYKNKFGKPSMKGRLELLLEKIEQKYGNSDKNS